MCSPVSTRTPGSPASPTSPTYSLPSPTRDAVGSPGGRTLRRKRSAANASLTSRPSQLTLRALFPSLQTMVLLHTTTAPAVQGGGTRLAHALFEPNFMVDQRGRTMRLDRETWERVRDLVEGLRIVGQSSASNLNGLPTPDASPDLGNLPVTEASAARFWDLAPEGGERGSRSTSTMFIQPRGGAGAMPVNRAGELLAYVVHGVGDGREVDLSKLPTQLCALLEEAEKLNDVADGQMEEEEACERALALLS